MPSSIWHLRSSATKSNLRVPIARPRMVRRKNGTTYSQSQHVPSSTGQHWNQNIGPRPSYMQYISTTAVSTPVPVSLLLKAGGESNPILSTSNFSVHAFVLSVQGIVDPNWTNTISPDYSLGTHLQTKIYGTSISTAASRKLAITPLSTRPGTCRTTVPRPHNSYTHLASNRTLHSPQARPTPLSMWPTTHHTLSWIQPYLPLPRRACVICLFVFPRPQISQARRSNQPYNLHIQARAFLLPTMPRLNHYRTASRSMTWLRFIYLQHPITMHLRRYLTCESSISLDIERLEWLFYPRITG